MVFEELLFDNSTLIKLKIFRSLLQRPPGQYTYQEIGAETQLRHSQLAKGLIEIETDLSHANVLTQSFLKPNVGVLTSAIQITPDQYLEMLLNESIPYQFLLATLITPDLGLDAFCRTNFISRSTLSRKMRKFSQFLESYKLKINYRNFCLEGSEDRIRLFYYYFIYLCHHNLSWPLTVTKEEAHLQVEKFADFFPQHGLYVTNIMLTIFSAVSITRIKQKRFVTPNARLDFLFIINPHYDLQRFRDTFDLDQKNGQNEARFIYFICNFFPFYEDPKDPNITKSLAAFQAVSNPVWQFGDRIVAFITDSLQLRLSPEIKNLLLANLYNSLLAFYIFDGPFPNFVSFIIPSSQHTEIEIELQNKLYLFLKEQTNLPEFLYFKNAILPLAKVIRQILFPLILRVRAQNRLRVAVAAEPNYLLNFNLLNFLRELSFVDTFLYQKEEEYDLVISTLTTLPTKAPVYYWTHGTGNKNFPHLYQVLMHYFMQKNGF